MNKNKAANAVSGLFAILVSALVYLIIGNLWVTLISFLFAFFLAKALRPFWQPLFEINKAPPATITVLRERGFEDEPAERIFYVLLITQDIMLDVEDAEQKAILEDLFEKSVVGLNEQYDFFR